MDILTLDKILDLPNEVLKTSKKYDEFSEPLRKSVIDQYNIKEIKEEITKKFNKFKDAKYYYNFQLEQLINLVPDYALKDYETSKSTESSVENIVQKQEDGKIWVSIFYKTLIHVSAKLTLNEAIYLVDSFFRNKSEEFIAERLHICKQTLQGIKMSCLVKVWLELKTLNDSI